MKNSLYVLFLALIVSLAVWLYRPRSVAELQLGPSTKVLDANQREVPEPQKAIKQMNEWLAANQFGWRRSFADSIPAAQFIEGKVALGLWENKIILNSPASGSVVKEVDSASLKEILTSIASAAQDGKSSPPGK